MKSKIVLFFLIAILLGINISCAEDFQNMHLIPDVSVNTRIDIGIGGGSSNWGDQPKYFSTSSTGEPLGYNGHGIIIFTRNNSEYKCYDATCTGCPDLTSFFKQGDLNGQFTKCSICETEFLLDYGYSTSKEIEIYPLKEYPITKAGNVLIVSHK